MRMVPVLALAGAVTLAFAGPSLADEQTTSPPSSNNPNEVICRNMPAGVGSRLGARRECHTRREWDERRLQDRQEIDKASRSDPRGPG